MSAQLSAALHERNGGADKVHVAANRLHHQASHLRAVQSKTLLKLCQVVVLKYQGVLYRFRRHTGAGRVAKGGQARASFDQQCIGVAVIAAFKLDDFAAAGGSACQTQGAHGGFSAGTDKANHFNGRDKFDDLFSQFDFTLGRCAKRKSVHHGLLHGFNHTRMSVAQNHRTPGADVIHIALTVCIPKIRALRALHETRRAAYRFKGANWRIHATRYQFFGTFKKNIIAGNAG